MENASKALLIAGGMLLFMLVLSFAVYLFRRVGFQSSEFYSEMRESDVSEFNQQFFKYDGKNDLTIQDVVSVINLARNSDQNQKIAVKVKIDLELKSTKFDAETGNVSELLANSQNYKQTYSCTIEIPNNSKVVQRVFIKEN